MLGYGEAITHLYLNVKARSYSTDELLQATKIPYLN